MPHVPRLDRLSKDKLLDLRMCDLGVTLEGTWLETAIDRVRDEIRAAGLAHFRPHFYLADEWCSPDEVPGVGIPFYLAHPRLVRLERRMMFEVEGGARAECMMLLRHEVGHALQHAYNLQRRRRWQKTFGKASLEYPDFYRPNPTSREFVEHLDGWYAQAHPVEDFAETFAVWVTPRSNWRERYEGWPAVAKLEYMDELAQDLSDEKHQVRSRAKPYSITQLRHTLRRHYERRQEHYRPGFTDQYDRELALIFGDGAQYRRRETAASFLRRHRREIRRQVARFTGEYQFTIDQVLRDIIGRCKELGLRLAQSERQTKLDFAIMLTAHSVHVLHRRDTWHPL